jgi:hypothetical protein
MSWWQVMLKAIGEAALRLAGEQLAKKTTKKPKAPRDS